MEENQELPPEEEEGEEEDPDAPQLQDMIQEQLDLLNARREADQGKVDSLVEEISELKIPVLEVNGDRPVQKTFQELCHVLKPFLFKREELIESKLVSAVPEENLKFYEKSFVYRKSRFDRVSPSDRFT